jgi:hypothetical protein
MVSFASVQNCETYPAAREKNKQGLENKTASGCFMDVRYNRNFDLFQLLTKEMLNKV